MNKTEDTIAMELEWLQNTVEENTAQERKCAGQCYGCAFRSYAVGSAHSVCSAKWSYANALIQAITETTTIPFIPPMPKVHGFESGWYEFPMNYDPIWATTPCLLRTTVRENIPVSFWNDAADYDLPTYFWAQRVWTAYWEQMR